jgi:hypothetical protein
MIAETASPLRERVERYVADRDALQRRYDGPYSPERRARLRAFYRGELTSLGHLDFDSLGVEGRIDWLLLERRLRFELHLLDREEERFAQMGPLQPFAADVLALHEARRRLEPIDPREAARMLDRIAAAAAPGDEEPSAVVAARAAALCDDLRKTLESWRGFYAGYDPQFTWWTAAPYAAAVKTLETHARRLREERAGFKPGEDDPILGDPIGSAGLQADLDVEMIPYSVQELIGIGERELAWCEDQLRAAASDLGFADWRDALEHVKGLHEPPGEQPRLVRELALEAIGFVEERDLVTIPPLAKEVWRMEMMTPDEQKVSPFFLGGEVIRVSFPTEAMAHDEKLMSLRGNNRHFSRATVQHELIPGHHLQLFAVERSHPHRNAAFGTCFWIEGWTLHWEMLLWELGFARGPEDRIGMLFWRTHRAARVLFSLKFHLGEMTPEECVALLVEGVGHEPANARAEVRRSLKGDYPPLYQAAYLLGGLQVHALYRECVEGGRMSAREFHDAFLGGNQMPIELARARLLGHPLGGEFRPSWRFTG